LKPLDWARSRRAGVALATATAGSLLLIGVAAAPASSSTSPSGKVAVPQGIGAAVLKPLSVFGPTPPNTPEQVSFVLKARGLRQLEASVDAGMPRGYLSVGQFAHLFGQPLGNVLALEKYLNSFGIKTRAYRDGLDVASHGTAGEYDKALSVKQNNYSLPATKASDGQPGRAAMTIHGTTDSALLPRRLAAFVLSILGITNYPSFATNLQHAAKPATGVTLKESATFKGTMTPTNFAKRYNLDPLYAEGATGAGETIGIVTLASLNPENPEYFWKNIMHISTKPDRIRLVNIDGGAGPVSLAAGSDETTLDVEQSGGVAPDANIRVYQAPNSDPGFLDAFFAAASQNIADTVSTSWGESETSLDAGISSDQESPAYYQATDEAFLELAAQGQSMFDAAGDSGAYDASGDIGTTNLSVDNPADSPYATAGGGTTLGGKIDAVLSPTLTVRATIKAQRAWGWDWLWPLWKAFGAKNEATFAEENVGGGGGGYALNEPEPPYQRLVFSANQFSAVEYLTPTDYQDIDGLQLPTEWNFTAKPSVTTGYGTGRVVPDVSVDADPFTGYYIYDTQYPSEDMPALDPGWGGTSFVGPQLNGSTAVIDSLLGHRVGFWNPAIYRFAASGNSPFTPLDTTGRSNDNLYYTGTRGHIYNVGTGLGYPNLAELASDFARQ
jgi:kumamolisin